MKEFYVSVSGAIQGHHGPLVIILSWSSNKPILARQVTNALNLVKSKAVLVELNYADDHLIIFLAHLSTTCSRGAFRVVRCPSSVVCLQQFL